MAANDSTLNVPSEPNIDIPSLPYKKLPFPFNDLTTAPQPDHTQVYPDNIPPTVATVAGMHPTGNQGQIVNTDGNNALLVHDVAGGGGASPVSPNNSTFFHISGASPDYSQQLQEGISYLHSVTGYIAIKQSSSVFVPEVKLELQIGTNPTNIELAYAQGYDSTAGSGLAPLVYPFSLSWAFGLDLTWTGANASNSYIVNTTSNVEWAAIVCTLIFKDST